MKPKKILYIHGYNSSGSTGRVMQEIFPKYFPDCEVIAPKISPYFVEAQERIEEIIKENNIDLVIGTSLGGFMTLKINNPKVSKIVINPVFDPFEDLAEIDAPKDIYESYRNKSIYNQSFNDSNLIGIFGDKDILVNYREDFKTFFPGREVVEVSEMEHQIKSEEIEKILVKIINKF
ncbi:MAG: hypothetical protein J1F35_05720 [Erysipelotrichales bacterium]|nr:hypothetical protein [Erysipelotrichales bacterium]